MLIDPLPVRRIGTALALGIHPFLYNVILGIAYDVSAVGDILFFQIKIFRKKKVRFLSFLNLYVESY
jgi:hypothetical protein